MKLKKLWDISTFLVGNVFLNFSDVITDAMTAYALCKHIILIFTTSPSHTLNVNHILIVNVAAEIHAAWAMLTIFWMFAPFLLHLTVIVSKRKDDWKTGLKEAFQHFPLVVPVTNTFSTLELCKVEYADSMPVSSLTKIEKIKKEAGKLTQTESFMVSNISLMFVRLQLKTK